MFAAKKMVYAFSSHALPVLAGLAGGAGVETGTVIVYVVFIRSNIHQPIRCSRCPDRPRRYRRVRLGCSNTDMDPEDRR